MYEIFTPKRLRWERGRGAFCQIALRMRRHFRAVTQARCLRAPPGRDVDDGRWRGRAWTGAVMSTTAQPRLVGRRASEDARHLWG